MEGCLGNKSNEQENSDTSNGYKKELDKSMDVINENDVWEKDGCLQEGCLCASYKDLGGGGSEECLWE